KSVFRCGGSSEAKELDPVQFGATSVQGYLLRLQEVVTLTPRSNYTTGLRSLPLECRFLSPLTTIQILGQSSLPRLGNPGTHGSAKGRSSGGGTDIGRRHFSKKSLLYIFKSTGTSYANNNWDGASLA
ncbi:hypothetical protein C0J52_14695, partial [Blattella germanica]